MAHLVGIVDDALGGRLSGPPSPEQTGEQVQRNGHTNLATLVDHWGAVVGPFEDVVSAASIWPAAIDIVSHELDIRSALGLRDGRDTDEVRRVTRYVVDGCDVDTTLIFNLGDEQLLAGAGSRQHRVPTTAFEVLRIRLGRRSTEQVLALPWSPALERVPPDLYVFGPRLEPLCE